MENTYLVLDIGGSAIKYSLMSEQGEFLEKGDVATPLDKMESLLEAIKSIHDQYPNVKGIGISMPGVIDMEKGIAYTGGALSYIVDSPFASLVEQTCHIPVTIGNDAKCAGYGEVGFGSLQDVEDAIVLIFGTGIGGCVIKDKKVHQGKHFAAGEVSSIKVDAGSPYDVGDTWAGRNGIFGLRFKVQQALETKEEFNGKQIFAMANGGNQKVISAIDAFCKDIAIQIFNLQVVFDPEKIAIGGGISVQPLLMELITKNMKDIFENSGMHPIAYPQVVPCKYGNDANLLGAFYQHLQMVKE